MNSCNQKECRNHVQSKISITFPFKSPIFSEILVAKSLRTASFNRTPLVAASEERLQGKDLPCTLTLQSWCILLKIDSEKKRF